MVDDTVAIARDLSSSSSFALRFYLLNLILKEYWEVNPGTRDGDPNWKYEHYCICSKIDMKNMKPRKHPTTVKRLLKTVLKMKQLPENILLTLVILWPIT